LSAVRNALAAARVSVQPAGQAMPQTPLASTISFIDNTVDVTTGTIRLRARFENTQRILWPGEFVPVTLDLPTSGTAIVVPTAAIAQGPKGAYLYVVDTAAKAEQRAVKVLRVTGAHAIVSGVQEGENVVVDGQSRLAPGAQVHVQSAAAMTTPAP
jgi:multidrug efflux system membrane fusion protein